MKEKVYVCNNLKSIDEYYEELKDIHRELGVGLETNTLISSDLDLLTRADELVVIINFLKQNGAVKVEKTDQV